jgi:hypothetical protein
VIRHFKKIYGGGPLHLLAHLTLVLIAAIVLWQMFGAKYAPQPWNLVLWLAAGLVLHDFVFLPIYSVANRAIQVPLMRHGPARVPPLNYLRVPFVLSAVLMITFFPRILDRQPQNFENALGHPPPDYFIRWVWVTVALFAISAVLYGVAWVRTRSRSSAAAPTAQ